VRVKWKVERQKEETGSLTASHGAAVRQLRSICSFLKDCPLLDVYKHFVLPLQKGSDLTLQTYLVTIFEVKN